jgi:hypothetical protein
VNQNNKDDRWYTSRGLTPPEHISHGLTVDDISKRVVNVNARNWRAEGNRLIADTDVGPLIQFIPTSHIFTGIDDQGLPTFRKL